MYDGRGVRLAVDGQWVPQPAARIRDVPSQQALLIGQYDLKEPRFAFHGLIRDVVISPEALLEPAP